MSIYNLTAPNIVVTPAPPTSSSSASPTSSLATTLLAHHTMLTSTYLAAYNSYTTAYTHLLATPTPTASLSFTEVGERVAQLLKQQVEILAFQNMLASFQGLIEAVEGGEKMDVDVQDEGKMWEVKDRQSKREKSVIGGDGGVGGGMWKGIHGVLR